jgi:hypothetical protein
MVSKHLGKMISLVSIFASFNHAKKILQDGFGIEISVTCLENYVHQVGQKLYNIFKVKGKDPDLCKVKGEESDVLYLQADGSMVPISGKEGLEYKENKLGLAYSKKDIALEKTFKGKSRVEIKNKRFVSSLGEGVEEFKKMFYSLALKKGLQESKEVILLCDGAKWLSKMKTIIFLRLFKF